MFVLTTSFLFFAYLHAVYEWANGSGDFTLIGIQLCAVAFIFGWTFSFMGAYFYFLNFMGWLRIDPLEEEVGMDISRHKGSAYDIQAVKEEHVKELDEKRQLILEDRSNSRHNRSIVKGTAPRGADDPAEQQADADAIAAEDSSA